MVLLSDNFASLIPRLIPAFQRCMKKNEAEPGKTYHVSDVVDGTDLKWNHVKSVAAAKSLMW